MKGGITLRCGVRRVCEMNKVFVRSGWIGYFCFKYECMYVCFKQPVQDMCACVREYEYVGVKFICQSSRMGHALRKGDIFLTSY